MSNRDIDSIEEGTSTVTEMEQISAQLDAITAQLNKLNEKQVHHDQLLTFLNHKIETPAPTPQMAAEDQKMDLFRIPDPIKSIPSFDGNKKQVTSWLKTAQETLEMFELLVPPQQFKMYLQAVKNKIEGKAKDILCLAGDPETFEEIKNILLDALGDKQELPYYKSLLWANKQTENMSIHIFYNKTKEVVQSIKSLARQNPIYNNAWLAICTFIEEDALAAFISGLKKPYFGYAQAAKPKNIEEAYAFLCKFSSNENIMNAKKLATQTTQPRGNLDQPFVKRQPWPAQDKQEPVPMEIDPSTRSRRTFTRKNINNHETSSELNSSNEIKEVNQTTSDAIPENENFWEEPDSDSED